jgi:hypothetical protein
MLTLGRRRGSPSSTCARCSRQMEPPTTGRWAAWPSRRTCRASSPPLPLQPLGATCWGSRTVVHRPGGPVRVSPPLPARLPLRVYPRPIRSTPGRRRGAPSSRWGASRGPGGRNRAGRGAQSYQRPRAQHELAHRSPSRSPYVNEHHPGKRRRGALRILWRRRGWGPDPLDQVVHGAAAIAHAWSGATGWGSGSAAFAGPGGRPRSGAPDHDS